MSDSEYCQQLIVLQKKKKKTTLNNDLLNLYIINK